MGEAFARNHCIPIQWPNDEMKKEGIKMEDHVCPYCLNPQRRNCFGVCFIFKSVERGRTFRPAPPKYPTGDPDYRILKRNWSRYTHYYFHIVGEVLGPMGMCVGSFLLFQTRCWINGHHLIGGELQCQGIRFRKYHHAFLWTEDPQALQAAADRLSAEIIRKRLALPILCGSPSHLYADR